jgi:hypothetical protein
MGLLEAVAGSAAMSFGEIILKVVLVVVLVAALLAVFSLGYGLLETVRGSRRLGLAVLGSFAAVAVLTRVFNSSGLWVVYFGAVALIAVARGLHKLYGRFRG